MDKQNIVVLVGTDLFEEDLNDDASSTCSFDYPAEVYLSLAEFVGISAGMMMIDKIGRISIMIWTSTVSVVFIALIAAYHSESTLSFTFIFISRSLACIYSGLVWVMTPEMYPTRMRVSSHSFFYIVSRCGAIIAIILADNASYTLGAIIVAIFVSIAAFLFSFFPVDTKKLDVDESERLLVSGGDKYDHDEITSLLS